MNSNLEKEAIPTQGTIARKNQSMEVGQVPSRSGLETAEIVNNDELVYYDQFCECQEFVIEECLESLLYSSLQKVLPVSTLSKYNQALLQNIIKQVYQQVSHKLKKQFAALQDKYRMKENLVQIQRIKQEYQVLSSLGYSDNIVDQDENQIFFEILLKNMKLLSNPELIDTNNQNQ